MIEEKPVVYVVDDDPSVLQSVDRLLRSAAYDVKTFTPALALLDFRHLDAPGCLADLVRFADKLGIRSTST
jgi:FixJ family two-component response regulator